MAKRFSSSSNHDVTITQKVRTLLYDSGHGDVVNEILVDGMRDVEQMARGGLDEHHKRLLLLEEAERNRLTESTVLDLIKKKDSFETVRWVKYGKRALLGSFLASSAAGFIWIIRMIWAGLQSHG